MSEDPDEVEVWCTTCNAKLFNAYKGDFPNPAIPCPNPKRCEKEREQYAHRSARP